MSYSGAGANPYWVSISNNGVTHNAGMVSEQIPVTVGGTYQANITFGYSATYASGASVTFAIYNAANAQIAAAAGQTVTNMTGGQQYTANSGTVTAPTGASYALCTVSQVGLPSTVNLLNVYSAQVNDQASTSVNVNYAFTWSFWPWSAIASAVLNWNYTSVLPSDSDSLVLDGQIELMGGLGGVECLVPRLLDSAGHGPRFRILAPPSLNSAAYGYEASYDLNAPQPTQDVVASMLLDGERPFGTRSSNRQMSIPVLIFGTMAGGMAQVLAAREYLMSVIDKPYWQVKWTAADTGLPMILDCFRALPSTPVYGFNYSAGGSATGSAVAHPNYPIALITLNIQALPYGRSDIDGVQSLQFSNGLVSGPAPASAVTIDNFSDFSSGLNPQWTADTTTSSPLGGTLVKWAAPAPYLLPYEAATYNGTLSAPVSIAGLPVISAFYGQAYDSQWPRMPAFSTSITVSWALKDNNGHVLAFSRTYRNVRWSADVRNPYWTQLNAPVPQNDVTFNYSQVASYTVRISNWTGSNTVGLVRVKAFLNSVQGLPQTIANQASPRGTVYNLFSLPGSARAPVNVECHLPAQAPQTREFTAVGASSWQVPMGVYSVQAEAWAGGGAGASVGAYGALVAGFDPILYAPLSANASDLSAFGNNGTAASVTFNQASTGITGQSSALLNGTSSTLAFPVNPYGISQLTVSAWFNSNGNSITGSPCLIANTNETGSSSGFAVFFSSGGQLTATIGNGTTDASITSSAAPSAKGWNHVALVLSAGTATLYLNGASAGSATLAGTVAPGLSKTTSVGYNVVNAGNYYPGLVQGIAIMETAMNAAEAAALYQSGAPAGAGGGGAEYAAEPALPVAPGAKVPVTVGGGGVPAQLTPTVLQFAKSGVISHWTCPANVTRAYVECWGGGAAGAAGGGGGGAGGYSAGFVTVVPGDVYWAIAGSGGTANTGTSAASSASRAGSPTTFALAGVTKVTSTLVYASGGLSPTTGSTAGGAGGTGDPSVAVSHTGGHGGSSPGTGGGGGGGAAGNTGNGGAGGDSPANSATGRIAGGGTGGAGAGSGDSIGGAGGAGASSPGFPARGAAPGGGGGGGYTGQPLFRSSVIVPVPIPAANFLGGDGAAGMVQVTYVVNGSAPVSGGNSSFGSSATTGTVVTAHGGSSATANSATPAAGGSGSSNSSHFSGGLGGYYTAGANASWFGSPFPARTGTAYLLNLSASGSYTASSGTSADSLVTCSQGVSVVLVKSAVAVADLAVTDSAGNVYVAQAGQAGGSSQNGITTYAFTASVAEAITMTTTITITSATVQDYSYLWYTSPWLVNGISAPNLATSSGTGSTISGTFGAGDAESVTYELVVYANDASATPSGGQPLYGNIAWYAVNATSSVTDSGGILQAFVGVNQGGGNGSTSAAGDTFSCGMSTSSNWSLICLPLVAASQQAAASRIAFSSGGSPGASTAWTAAMGISPNGMIAVVGMSQSAAPTGMTDASGNVYTRQSAQAVPGGAALAWMFTSPVTAGLAQGVSGHVQWGGASATPAYIYDVYWLPAVTGLDPAGVLAVTGSTSAVSAQYVPDSANGVMLASVWNCFPSGSGTGEHLPAGGRAGAPWNYVAFDTAANVVNGDVFIAQNTDNAALSVTGAYTSATNWCTTVAGFTTAPNGGGGGAAGGPLGAGYSASYLLGAPGWGGGAHGGNGATVANTPGGGGALPGGAGGGAVAVNSAVSGGGSAYGGGAGGQGLVRVTWQPPLTPFNTLLLHAPGEFSPANFNPLVPVPVTDLPNNTEYTVTVPSNVPYLNAEFNGTYTVILAAYAWNTSTAGSPRTLTVSVNQYEYPGGPRYTVQAARAVTPAIDVVNGLVNLGEVTLPVKDFATHNDQSYFTVSIMDSDQGDSFQDVIFLDTTGQTALLNIAPGTPGYGQYVSYYIDEPTPDRDLGFVGATTQGRQHQVSVFDYALLSGGPIYIKPGDNLLLAYSPAGAPDIGVTYSPRWFLDRTQ